MTWPEIATPHIDHKAKLLDVRRLRCFECDVTLVLPKPDPAETPVPPQYRRPDVEPASPETVAMWRARINAELAHRKRAQP